VRPAANGDRTWTWPTHVRPVLILVTVLAMTTYGPDLLFPPSPADLEHNSERIGWTPAIESDDLARDIAVRVNDERVARGLAPLVWHDGLAELSRSWSEQMLVTGYRHSPAAFRVLPDLHGIGENIAMGQTDAGGTHVGWMRSDGHRQNLLDPDHTAMGIGVVCRNDGRMWSTQLFGRPVDSYNLGAHGMPPVRPIVRQDDGPGCGGFLRPPFNEARRPGSHPMRPSGSPRVQNSSMSPMVRSH
jgi:uncharacterized protein YkwD